MLHAAVKMYSSLETLLAEVRDILYLENKARGIISSEVKQGGIYKICILSLSASPNLVGL
jgi:hypothetical protein